MCLLKQPCLGHSAESELIITLLIYYIHLDGFQSLYLNLNLNQACGDFENFDDPAPLLRNDIYK